MKSKKQICHDNWIKNNHEKWLKILRINSLKRRLNIHKEINNLLGNKCSNPNCLVPNGCTDVRCLQIDHVKGGGNKKRKVKGYNESSGSEMCLRRILAEIQSGSKDYQLLCANCNWIKRHENKEIPKIYN